MNLRLAANFSTEGVLAVVFASFYLAFGPGCFFSVDEVAVQETAQALFQRGTLDVPAMNTARSGVGGNYYSHRGPALGYIAAPFVAIGNFLDDSFGSMRGGVASGPPLGTREHPLRWGGRLAIFTALIVNALVGGATVAILFLIALRLGAGERAALLMAVTAGLSTPLTSGATHFFQHPLEALALLLAFWFLSDRDIKTLTMKALLGGLSLGIAILARPTAAPAAVVLWVYGGIVVWRETRHEAGHLPEVIRAAVYGTLTPVLCVLLYLYYNYLQFGNFMEFGYSAEDERFVWDLVHTLKGVFAYLFSPSLSIFLFAPPLLLAILSLRESHRRWPLAVKTLLAASLGHLLLISFYQAWHAGIAYGPRFMLAPILLLTPLMVPAFERVVRKNAGLRIFAVAATFAAGFFIQLLGLAVYVTTNEWHRIQNGINDGAAFVFVLSASPVLVHLRELLAGQNIIPWVTRAWVQPGPVLAFWVLLLAILLGGSWWLVSRHFTSRAEQLAVDLSRRSEFDHEAFAKGLVITLALLILSGFLMTRRVNDPLNVHIFQMLNAGLSAQRAGRQVAAQEQYALVLGLEPRNKFALYNLALLYEGAGMVDPAIALYERALKTDPVFAPALHNLSRFKKTAPHSLAAQPTPAASSDACDTPVDCYQSGKRLWDAGEKRGALAIWEKGAQVFPQEGTFIRNVARARYDLGDYEGAVRDYRKAVTMLPQEIGVQADLAWALLRANRSAEAREVCEKVLARSPDNPDAKAILSQIEGKSER